MKIVIDGEMITAGIQAVTTSKAAGNGNVYNLSGQLVGKAESVADLPKGIYITRGKKVIQLNNTTIFSTGRPRQ